MTLSSPQASLACLSPQMFCMLHNIVVIMCNLYINVSNMLVEIQDDT